MTVDSCLYRFAVGSIYGLALFAASSECQLNSGFAFSDFALPLCLGLGYLLASPRSLLAPVAQDRAPTWLLPVCLISIGAVSCALVYGALATPSRHWDGVVAWELKADFLTQTPSLDQDFFTGDGVYHHSRDYPLLQPLCIAATNRLLGIGTGRLLFPFLYLLLLALVATTLRNRCSRAWLATAGITAVGLTPMLVNPTMGGADSGFADLFLATAVAGIAAGLVLGQRTLLATAIFLAVMVKPEGLVYGALPIAILWHRQERAAMRAALTGYCLALAVWLPLQHRLQHLGQGGSILVVVLASLIAAATLIVSSDLLLQRLNMGSRGRSLVVALGTLAALIIAPMLMTALGSPGGILGAYLSDLGRLFERLPRIPAIAFGFVNRGILNLRFAMTFLLFAMVLAASIWGRRKLPEPRLSAFTILGLLSLSLPFLLSPEEDLRHHIRSSLDRLLLHWLAPVWLLTTLAIDAREVESN